MYPRAEVEKHAASPLSSLRSLLLEEANYHFMRTHSSPVKRSTQDKDLKPLANSQH